MPVCCSYPRCVSRWGQLPRPRPPLNVGWPLGARRNSFCVSAGLAVSADASDQAPHQARREEGRDRRRHHPRLRLARGKKAGPHSEALLLRVPRTVALLPLQRLLLAEAARRGDLEFRRALQISTIKQFA